MGSASLRLVHDAPGIETFLSHRPGRARQAASHDLLSEVLVGALVADRGAEGARRFLCERHPGRSEAALLAELLAMVDAPLRLRDLMDRVEGTEQALAVYHVARTAIDGERAGGRVFLEDLAETLLLPPTLLRWFEERCTATAEKRA